VKQERKGADSRATSLRLNQREKRDDENKARGAQKPVMEENRTGQKGRERGRLKDQWRDREDGRPPEEKSL